MALFLSFALQVPTRLGKTVLPALYLTYLASTCLSSIAFARTSSSNENLSQKNGNKRVPPPVRLFSNLIHFRLTLLIQCSRDGNTLLTVIFSLPSSSLRLRVINFAVNTLLLLASAELLFLPVFDRASDVIFTRVGAVYPDAVKILIRYPQPNVTEGVLRVVWREIKNVETNGNRPWREGPVVRLAEENDWINTVKLNGLWPSRSYECEAVVFFTSLQTDIVGRPPR